VFIESNHRDAPIKPLSSGERAILTKLCHWHDDSDATSAALGSPETPVWGAQEATAFPNCRIVCPPWWLGKSRQKHLAAVTFMAQFAFKFTARTQTTHRPTSHGPWPMLSVFDRPWPDNDILRCSGPTGTKRRQKRLSSVILACFGRILSETQPNCCRIFAVRRSAIIIFLRHRVCCMRLPKC